MQNFIFTVWHTDSGEVYSVRIRKPYPYQRKTSLRSKAPFGYKQDYTQEEFLLLDKSKRVLELFSAWRQKQYEAESCKEVAAFRVRMGVTFYCWEF